MMFLGRRIRWVLKKLRIWGVVPWLADHLLAIWPTRLGGLLLWVPPTLVFATLCGLALWLQNADALQGVSVFWTIIGIASLTFTDLVRRRTGVRWRAAKREFGALSVAGIVALSIHRFTLMIEAFHFISISVGLSTLALDPQSFYRIFITRNILVAGQMILFMMSISVFLGDELAKRMMKSGNISVTQIEDDGDEPGWWKRMWR